MEDILNTPWFDPNALDKSQEDFRNKRFDNLNIKNDFASYAIANRGDGLQGASVNSHNLVKALPRIKQYNDILGRTNFNRIADIGCGLGITTNALAEYYVNSKVTGFDVSLDAVEFATKNFPRAEFVKMAISPSTPLPYVFDLILCQEFYPFTRTNDFDFHNSFIQHFLNHLSPNGVLLIELSERDYNNSVMVNLNKIVTEFDTYVISFDKIYNILHNFFLSRTLSMIIGKVLSVPYNRVIIIEKSKQNK